MEKNSGLCKYMPVIDGEDFPDFMLPSDYTSPVVKVLATTVPLNRDLSDLLEESIVKLFKEVFDIDIKTCTEE